MAYHKTVIQVEVLSDGPYEFYDIHELPLLYYAIVRGDCSGRVEVISQKPLTEKQLIKECDKHHTDPEFFLGE